MNSWQRRDETTLLNKKASYSQLNLEDITIENYIHAQKVFEESKIKLLGQYHVQRDTLLLLDASENFRKKCIEIYKLDPDHSLSALGLAWQACLRKTKVKLELLKNNDMLMMVEKGIKGRICHAIYKYAKANNKYMKNYDKNIESSDLLCLDGNNLYGRVMSQTLPVNGFKWKKNIFKFDEDFIKNYDEDSIKGYILEVDVEYLKRLLNLRSDLPFLSERMKIKKCNKLVCNINGKENYVVHIRASKQALNHGSILKKNIE